MLAEEVKALLASHLPGCDISVEGEGANFQVVAVGEVFDGLNAVKRQQTIYAGINNKIASGDIHAVTIQTYTPAEWAAK